MGKAHWGQTNEQVNVGWGVALRGHQAEGTQVTQGRRRAAPVGAAQECWHSPGCSGGGLGPGVSEPACPAPQPHGPAGSITSSPEVGPHSGLPRCYGSHLNLAASYTLPRPWGLTQRPDAAHHGLATCQPVVPCHLARGSFVLDTCRSLRPLGGGFGGRMSNGPTLLTLHVQWGGGRRHGAIGCGGHHTRPSLFDN